MINNRYNNKMESKSRSSGIKIPVHTGGIDPNIEQLISKEEYERFTGQ